MNRIKKEIECLTKFQSLTGQLDEILQFLKLENIIDDNHIRSVKNSPDRPKEVQVLLKELQTKQKLQLLEYQWTILPVEIITITIVTDRNKREFAFNGG